MHRRETLMRSTVTVLVTYAGTAGFTALLTLYLVRALGTAGFGTFSLAMGIAGLAALIVDFGISGSVARFMAERIDDRGALAQIFAVGLRLKVLAGLAVAVALVLLAGPIANAYDEPSLAGPIRALALANLLQSVVMQLSSSFLAISQTAYNLRMVVLEGAAEMTASVALVVLTGGATAAAFGRAIGYGVGALVGLVLMVQLLGRRSVAMHRRADFSTEKMSRYALWLWLAGSAYAIFFQLDVIVIGAVLGPAAAGAFSAPLRLSALLAYPSLALGNTVTPRLARQEDDTSTEPIDIQGALRWLVITQAALTVPLLVWARPLVDTVLGGDYADSVPVVRIMAAFIFVQGFAPMLSLTANYLGEARRRFPWALGAIVVNLVIDLALLKSIGVQAAAIGSGVAISVYVLGHVLICRHLVVMPLKPFLVTLARTFVAAEVMSAVLLAFGTDHVSPLKGVAGLIASVVAYGAVLVVTREVALSELRPPRRHR